MLFTTINDNLSNNQVKLHVHLALEVLPTGWGIEGCNCVARGNHCGSVLINSSYLLFSGQSLSELDGSSYLWYTMYTLKNKFWSRIFKDSQLNEMYLYLSLEYKKIPNRNSDIPGTIFKDSQSVIYISECIHAIFITE